MTRPDDIKIQVLLDKGANKLARNKKGRKPGDVFSPTVEDDKKERIKNMLGMGAQQVQEAAPATAATAAAPAAAGAAAATAVAAGATAAGAKAARGAAGSSGGNGVMAGGSSYNGDVSSLTAAAVPPPAYKVGDCVRQIDEGGWDRGGKWFGLFVRVSVRCFSPLFSLCLFWKTQREESRPPYSGAASRTERGVVRCLLLIFLGYGGS